MHKTMPRRSLLATVNEEGYSARAIDVIQRIALAEREVDVLELLHEAKGVMGVEQAMFVSFIRNDESNESYRFVVACDWRWCRKSGGRAPSPADPWLRYAAKHSDPIPASQIRTATQEDNDAIALARQCGMVSTCLVPTPAGGGLSRLGVLILSVSVPGYFEAAGFTSFKVLARSLAMELNEWWVRRARQDLVRSARITFEDIELLRLQRLGLGTKEVAAELRITAASVDSRWQRLNSKMRVPHRAEAARMAAEYGLV